MVLDASAVIAILLHEPKENSLKMRIGQAPTLHIGAPSVLEAMLVMGGRKGEAGIAEVREFVKGLAIQVVPFTEAHTRAAEDAFMRYGKGRNPAGLNFGDCMAYAVAKLANAPLLFVGNDFTRTDISAA